MKSKGNKRVAKQIENIPGGGYFSLLKDKLSTNINNKIEVRLGVVIFTILVGLFIVGISVSYAYWNVNVEKGNNLNIIAGVLNYNLTGAGLDSSSRTVVGANSSKIIDMTVTSLNTIDSRYIIYYNGILPSGVSVTYLDGSGLVESDISTTNHLKTVTVIIENTSEFNQTISFGVQGGLSNRNLTLDGGKYKITDKHYLDKSYAYTGNYQLYTVAKSGYYNIEAWGAQGGTSTKNQLFKGTNGSYTSGKGYFNVGDILYIYVGEHKEDNYDEAYNGGGSGKFFNNGDSRSSGGGATDIRLNFNNLASRIMVSAGAGGTGLIDDQGHPDFGKIFPGGAGGDLLGYNGVKSNGWSTLPSETAKVTPGGGGTQISGGAGGNSVTPGWNGVSGSFGKGANASTNVSPGGGGGYYGGGTSGIVHDILGSAGGGSSYISGYAGVNAVDQNISHTNNTLHYSGKYFVDGKMQSGINSGNGKAKITYISNEYPKINSKFNSVRYVKDCINGSTSNGASHWVELQAIKDGKNLAKGRTVTGSVLFEPQLITDGNIGTEPYAGTNSGGQQCITVDLGATYDLDEVAVWHYYGDNRSYYNHTLSVSSNNSNWNDIIFNRNGIKETSNGIRVNAWGGYSNTYAYTGGPQTFVVPVTGQYNIELWGAQGGGSIGGKGSYTQGNIQLVKNETIYIHIGEHRDTSGGNAIYNGGGFGTNNTYKHGGGATDIRLQPGAWNDPIGLRSRIMVSAGGGGAAINSDSNYTVAGGPGGALTGISGGESTDNSNYLTVALGGNQTAGGAGGISVTPGCNGSNGNFGQGGNGTTASGCGGGGGYYGGGGSGVVSSVAGSGAGGSSYISNYPGCVSIISDTNQAPNNGVSLHYSKKSFFNSRMLAGNQNMPNPGGGAFVLGNAGNGYARITLVQ